MLHWNFISPAPFKKGTLKGPVYSILYTRTLFLQAGNLKCLEEIEDRMFLSYFLLNENLKLMFLLIVFLLNWNDCCMLNSSDTITLPFLHYHSPLDNLSISLFLYFSILPFPNSIFLHFSISPFPNFSNIPIPPSSNSPRMDLFPSLRYEWRVISSDSSFSSSFAPSSSPYLDIVFPFPEVYTLWVNSSNPVSFVTASEEVSAEDPIQGRLRPMQWLQAGCWSESCRP